MRYQTTKKKISDGVIGTLITPVRSEKHGAVLVLPGSDGGIPEGVAHHLAVAGHTALALAYFGVPGLPEYLENIPLEYVLTAIEIMRNLPLVSSITLLGYSRGGELALLLSSLFPKSIDGTIAFVPSNIVNGGFPYSNRPAWTFEHRLAWPFVGALMDDHLQWSEAEDLRRAVEEEVIPHHHNTQEDPYHVVDLFLAKKKIKKSQIAAAAIEVEKISSPLLLISGGQDTIWPASAYCEEIATQLKQKNSPIFFSSLFFPEAGHAILAPYSGAIYHPVGHFWCLLGGSASGNRHAHEESWRAMLQFLERISHSTVQ